VKNKAYVSAYRLAICQPLAIGPRRQEQQRTREEIAKKKEEKTD